MWIDFIRVHAQRTPKRVALVIDETGETLTYADLDRFASRWAANLHRQGVVKGDRIAFLGQNCLEHLTLFFGCAKIGAVFVPLNVRLAVPELEAQIARIQPKILYGTDTRIPCIDPQVHPPGEETAYPPIAIESDDVLMVLFTSGSTGEPKGVMLHAGMLLWNIINTNTDWGLRADDRTVVQMPFFHSGGYNVTCLPLLRLGGTLVMTGAFDPVRMLHIIERYKITAFFAVPTMFRMMQEQPRFSFTDFSSIRFCISGGAPMPVSLIAAYREVGVPLKQGFGMTEVGPNCFTISDADAMRRPDTVGRPMFHSEVLLLDENGEPVSDGEIGELAIKGPHVCKGYWQNEVAFDAVFVEGFFRTGDLMRRDPEGFFYVIGRRKEMYISGGENVYPGEVVRQIVQHPAVREAVVLPVTDEKWGEVGLAFARLDGDLTIKDLRAFLDTRLSRYKHPRYLFALDSFPLLPNNKIDMNKLAAMAREHVTRQEVS